jgi:hypothetical protein
MRGRDNMRSGRVSPGGGVVARAAAAWLFEHFHLTPDGIRDAALELVAAPVVA